MRRRRRLSDEAKAKLRAIGNELVTDGCLVLGTLLLVVGVDLIYRPAAFIVSGAALIGLAIWRLR